MATLEIIQARIKKLQTQAEALIAQGAQGALDQIRELMIRHGLTTEDIERRAKARRDARFGIKGGAKKAASATKGKLPPKYRDPKTGATWSGHARPPAWIKDVKDRSKFLIDAAAAVAESAVAVKAPTKKAAVKKAAAKKAVGRKAAKNASAAGVKTVAKKAAVKSAGKKTAAKKAAAKSAAPAVGKRAVAKKAAAKAPAKKATARKAPAKSMAPVVEAPVTVQTPAAPAGEA
ncbi:MAG TPA: H-NS histone family protein [Paraburkholderia sp.]|jgi:DNA-binding protein H-NS|nr:H-NS histone family protein [Paraburkholderia sp.]